MFLFFQKCLQITCQATSSCIEHMFKKCWYKIEELCTTYVWIYLIASMQGNCIIKITVWCSNNSPNMKCSHFNFWFPDSLRSCSQRFQRLFPGPLLSLVEIVMHAFFLECSGTYWGMFECESIKYVCCSFPLFHNPIIILLTTFADLPNVQREYWCIFFMLWNLSPVVKIRHFFSIFTVVFNSAVSWVHCE